MAGAGFVVSFAIGSCLLAHDERVVAGQVLDEVRQRDVAVLGFLFIAIHHPSLKLFEEHG